MGKKSLLASTTKKKGGGESGDEKEKKTKATTGSTKKVTQTTSKKKTPVGVAAKKEVAPKKGGASKRKATPTKRATPKKKAEPKKRAAPKKKVAPKKAAAPKRVASPEKTVAPKSRAASRSASTVKSGIKPKAKTPATKKKPVPIKNLLSKKFDISVPEKQYAPPKDADRGAETSSPPFFVGATPEETERIQRLLIKKFDMTFSKVESKPTPEKHSGEKLSGDMSPSVVSASGEDDNDIDASAYSSVDLESSPPAKKMDSMQKALLIGVLGLVILLGLVVSASISNTAKFYMKPVKGELEIWKGKFSPMGKKKFVTLGAIPMPDQPKEIYSKNEIFPFIFKGYVNQADALLNVSDMPDFELIKRTLNKASAFAVSPELNEVIQRRLSKINLMTLVYKADILADKNTAADLASAREALDRAMQLNLDEAEKGLINQKLQWVYERQAQLEQMENEAEAEALTGTDR